MDNFPSRIQRERPLITEYEGLGMYEYKNYERPRTAPSSSSSFAPFAPKKNEPHRRPRLIQPIEGIVYSDPQAVYDFLISRKYPVAKNSASATLASARKYVNEKGEQGVMELLRLHPDASLICKAMGGAPSSSSSFTGDEQIDGTKLKDVPDMKAKDIEAKIIYWGNQVSTGLVDKELGAEFIRKGKEAISKKSDPDSISLKIDKKNTLLYGIVALLVLIILIGVFRRRTA
jgi:hypothetical protein